MSRPSNPRRQFLDANLAVGFAADERDYGAAAAMLRALSVQSIALMTNNPDKLQKLADEGIVITPRVDGTDEALVVRAEPSRSEAQFVPKQRSLGALAPSDGAR